MWWYQAKKYVQYLWRSKNQHGVHSPFVYDLLTKGLYPKPPRALKSQLRATQNYFSKINRTIAVNDVGAGSRVFKNNERSLRKIAKYAGMPYRQQLLMSKLTKYLKPARMLELGTSVGLGTAAMYFGHPTAKITTVEHCTNTLNEAKKFFRTFNATAIDTQNKLFADYLNSLEGPLDLVYVDGAHTKDITLKTFEQLLPLTHNDTVIIFDDIYWSKQMGEAWQIIKEHPKVTITIDSFDWGWVFFRKEQQKQHFVLRV